MRTSTLLILAFVNLLVSTRADPPVTNSASSNRVLMIDRCSTVVSGARATLIIGPLSRTGNMYVGGYQMKVSPYFFKGEKGKLAILVSDESMTKVDQGLQVEITGTATSNGRSGKTRSIDATASPVDRNHGALKLWFVADETKMVFDTSYRFAEQD